MNATLHKSPFEPRQNQARTFSRPSSSRYQAYKDDDTPYSVIRRGYSNFICIYGKPCSLQGWKINSVVVHYFHATCLLSRRRTTSVLTFGLLIDELITIQPRGVASSAELGLPRWWEARANLSKLFTVAEEPKNPTMMPSVGNGYVSYVIGSPTIYVAGVYNGPAETENPSHRARLRNFQNIGITNVPMNHAGLDVDWAAYMRSYDVNENCRVTIIHYAHQVRRHVLITEIFVDNTANEHTCEIKLSLNSGAPSDDVTETIHTTTDRYTTFVYKTKIPELENGPLVSVGVTTSNVPSSAVAPAKQRLRLYYFTTFYTSLETLFVAEASIDEWDRTTSSRFDLWSAHVMAWRFIWNSRIEIGGNPELAKVVNTSLYYLLSSMRADWAWSLSPGGLASNAYNGHMFWDAETWMYPPTLTLYPDLARSSILQYRLERLYEAHNKALSYKKGWTGLMFPWESAFSGAETCPTTADTGLLEHHITGDVSFAMRQYYYHTKDLNWLKSAYKAIYGIAEFWASRVLPSNVPNQFVINNVIPPDEYAVGVNNSVYTNYVAKISLEWAIEAANILNDTTVPINKWLPIISGLKLPFDSAKQIHLEYDGYNGQVIKQADVILLGYPLEQPMEKQVRYNDLAYYEAKTDHQGPAMTWSMHVVGWLEMDHEDFAAKNWPLSYANSQQPFGVWTETPTGGATNFITGAGGFLQGLLNGYGGIRVRDIGIMSFRPRLPPNTTHIVFRGIRLAGAAFDVAYNSTHTSVTMVSTSSPSLVVTPSQQSPNTLVPLTPFTFTASSFKVMRQT